MDALIQLGIFLALLCLGYFFGRRAESKHYQHIYAEEERLRHVVLLTERLPPPAFCQRKGQMVSGSVVISVDYFKTVIAGLRNIIGGNISAYESLLDRGRREALLRMQKQADTLGADVVINVKFETSRIAGNAGKGLGSIEILAYGTALS